jgi:hypothetical protein
VPPVDTFRYNRQQPDMALSRQAGTMQPIDGTDTTGVAMTTTRESTGSGLAPLVAEFYADAPVPVRLSLLRALLRPVGPLALVAIAAGAFARLLPDTPRWQGARVTPDDAAWIAPDHVFELARYLEQKSPELLWRLPELLGDSRILLGTISGSLLLIALRLHRPRPARGTEDAVPGARASASKKA